MGSEFLACPKELRLPTVRSCYEQQAELARREGLSYERYLEQVPGARTPGAASEADRAAAARVRGVAIAAGCRQLPSIRKMTYCN